MDNGTRLLLTPGRLGVDQEDEVTTELSEMLNTTLLVLVVTLSEDELLAAAEWFSHN